MSKQLNSDKHASLVSYHPVCVIIAIDSASANALSNIFGVALAGEKTLRFALDLHPNKFKSQLHNNLTETELTVVIAHHTALAWIERIENNTLKATFWFVELAGLHLQALDSTLRSASLDLAAKVAAYARKYVPITRWIKLSDASNGPNALLNAVNAVLSSISDHTKLQLKAKLFHQNYLGNLEEYWEKFQNDFSRSSVAKLSIDVNGIYSCAGGKLGCCFLSEGWSHNERLHVWSEGHRAAILLPLQSDLPPVMCRLRALRGSYEFQLRIVVNSEEVLQLSFCDDHGHDLDIEFPIAGTSADNITFARIDLLFSATWSPKLRPSTANDTRELAIALRSIEFRPRCPNVELESARRLKQLATQAGLTPSADSISERLSEPRSRTQSMRGGICIIDLPSETPTREFIETVLGFEARVGPIATLLLTSETLEAWSGAFENEDGASDLPNNIFCGSLQCAGRLLYLMQSVPVGIITNQFATAIEIVNHLARLFPGRFVGSHLLVLTSQLELSLAERAFASKYYTHCEFLHDRVYLTNAAFPRMTFCNERLN